MVYIQKGNRDMFSHDVVNFRKCQKAAEVINDIMRWQSQPHYFHHLPRVLAFIEESLNLFADQVDVDDYFWNLSLEREPRKREDEKMARLLQESGFL
jgi:son of sevenless-like protein